MATTKTMPQQITLELSSPKITAKDFCKSIHAFIEMINEVTNEFAATSADRIEWTVSVSSGSASIHLRGESLNPDIPLNNIPNIIRAVQSGLQLIDKSSKRPPYFSDTALRNAKILSKASNCEDQPIKIISDDKIISLSSRMSINIDSLFATAYTDWGSIEGILRVVSKKKGNNFYIYDDLLNKDIPCKFNNEMLSDVLLAFGKRVCAIGLLFYNRNGDLKYIKAEEIMVFPDPKTLPKSKDVYGLLKGLE